MHAMIHAPMWAQFMFIAAVTLIFGFYILIGWQFWDALKNEKVGLVYDEIDEDQRKKEGARAFGALLTVFILCAFAGYFSKLIFFFIPSSPPEMWVYMLSTHGSLSLCAGYYALTRQVNHIAARFL